MKPYYQDNYVTIYLGDCREILPQLPDNSVDLVLTDPPYGIGFMGKDWDKALPDKQIWVECLRILKAGAFAFVMSIPRADCLSRMIISLEDAGFLVNFTPIFWAYASGFPKAQNIGKAVDKRLGAERKVIGIKPGHEEFANRGNLSSVQSLKGTLGGEGGFARPWMDDPEKVERYHQLTGASTPQAKALDGSYGGFQPKPAVEVIIVAMKPLSEKTFVDQALKNGKGITWLDDVRIPYESEGDLQLQQDRFKGHKNPQSHSAKSLFTDIKDHSLNLVNPSGRFPANLLVSDDVLNTGEIFETHQATMRLGLKDNWIGRKNTEYEIRKDSGSFSRYFDLDKWWENKLKGVINEQISSGKQGNKGKGNCGSELGSGGVSEDGVDDRQLLCEETIKALPDSVQKTFPFLIVPKASKSEKNRGCEGLGEEEHQRYGTIRTNRGKGYTEASKLRNYHPTVKPLKLMSYLITLGSREGDTIVDPFVGSGTTPLASQLLGRKCIGIEIEEKYCEISANRCRQMVMELS